MKNLYFLFLLFTFAVFAQDVTAPAQPTPQPILDLLSSLPLPDIAKTILGWIAVLYYPVSILLQAIAGKVGDNTSGKKTFKSYVDKFTLNPPHK
jgi:MFS family permease